jgi:hypothetical protein
MTTKKIVSIYEKAQLEKLYFINERMVNHPSEDTFKFLNNNFEKECIVSLPFQKVREALFSALKNVHFPKNFEAWEKYKEILKNLEPVSQPNSARAVVRGNVFNLLVKEYLISLKLHNHLHMAFECHHPDSVLSERPDWFLESKTSNKILIGMNSTTFASSGKLGGSKGLMQVINRKPDTQIVKTICIISDLKKFRIDSSSSTFDVYHIGFLKNRIIFLPQLEGVIKEFFNL